VEVSAALVAEALVAVALEAVGKQYSLLQKMPAKIAFAGIFSI
jgi:hypothetical protein